MLIRLVEVADIPNLAHTYVQVFNSPEEPWTIQKAAKLIEHYLARSPYLCYLAEKDNRIIGAYLSDMKPSFDGPHLVDGDLFVLPQYQQAKIGTRLALAVGKSAASMGATRIDTYTFRHGFQLSWYLSKGFHIMNDWILITADLKKGIELMQKSL